MFGRKSKKDKKVDILQMTDAERAKFIREVRKALHNSVIERKLWSSLLSAENIEVNGNIIYNGNAKLNGLKWNRI